MFLGTPVQFTFDKVKRRTNILIRLMILPSTDNYVFSLLDGTLEEVFFARPSSIYIPQFSNKTLLLGFTSSILANSYLTSNIIVLHR